MEMQIIIGGIILGLLLFSLIFAKNKAETIVNFLLRLTTGILGIYFINLIFRSNDIDLAVGINLITIVVNGVLGIPGLALLYGIAWFL